MSAVAMQRDWSERAQAAETARQARAAFDEAAALRPLARLYLESVRQWSPWGGLASREPGWLAEEAIVHHALAGFPGAPRAAAIECFPRALRFAADAGETPDAAATWRRIEARRRFAAAVLGVAPEALAPNPPVGLGHVCEDPAGPAGIGYVPRELAFPVDGDARGSGLGWAAMILPVIEHGALVDLLALILWPREGAAAGDPCPYALRADLYLWRTGEARILGLDYAEAALELGAPVRLTPTPARWLTRQTGGEETACILDGETWETRRILLEAEVECETEDLARKVYAFRKAADAAAKKGRGKILVKGGAK